MLLFDKKKKQNANFKFETIETINLYLSRCSMSITLAFLKPLKLQHVNFTFEKGQCSMSILVLLIV